MDERGKDLMELAERYPSTVTLAVTAGDLAGFARALLREGIEAGRRERAEDRLLTRDEEMRTLGVAPQTLWRWGRAGYLHPVRVGAKVRYWKSEITAVLQPGKGDGEDRENNKMI